MPSAFISSREITRAVLDAVSTSTVLTWPERPVSGSRRSCDFTRTVATEGAVLQVTRAQAMEIYARYFCEDAVKRWPTWFRMSGTSRQFLERQPTIHNCFATGVRDPEARKAVTDKFRVEKLEKEIVTHYRSPNHLCDLYEALARWIIRYYGERATIWQTQCTRRGDPECEIHVRWEEDGAEQQAGTSK